MKKETVDVPLVVFVTRFVAHFFELGGILHDKEVMPGQARASPAPARAVRTFRAGLFGGVVIHFALFRVKVRKQLLALVVIS